MKRIVCLTIYVIAMVAAVTLNAEELLFPITTTVGNEHQENAVQAAKNKLLATLMITDAEQRGLLLRETDYGESEYTQSTRIVVIIDGYRWTVWVANHDERDMINMGDLLSFWGRPSYTYDVEHLLTFSDQGLDGNCDFGIVPAALSGDGNEHHFSIDSNEGVEYAEEMQRRMEEVVDQLLVFYLQDIIEN